jgi:hypothetical protein
MEISRSDLEATFGALDDCELLGRVEAGELTELAAEVALAEIGRRGLAPPVAGKPDVGEDVELASDDDADLVTIARYTYPTEAHIVCNFLQSEGVYAALIGAHQMQAVTPWDANLLGRVRLVVPVAQVDAARELLRAFSSGEVMLPTDDDSTPT